MKKLIIVAFAVIALLSCLTAFFACGAVMNTVYTVKFETYCDIEIEPGHVLRGQKLIPPEEPEKQGYNFTGWITEGGEEFKFDTLITSSFTLFARWEILYYDIFYELDGGVNNVSNPDRYSCEQRILLADPDKKGYAFEGWFKDQDFSKRVYSIEKGSTGDRILYAGWSLINYKINYFLFGGQNDVSNPSSYNCENEYSLNDPQLAYRTFLGWYSDPGFTNRVYRIEKGLTGELNLYALWDEWVEVFFDTAGGSEVTSQRIPRYCKAEIPDDPAKKGYTFLGWLDAGGNKYDFDTPVAESLFLYADWQVIEYSISYELKGGTNSPHNPQGYTTESEDIFLLPAVKTGYDFLNWANEKGETVTQITKGSVGDIILYAEWKAKTYKITYNLGGGENSPLNPDTYTIESDKIILRPATRRDYNFTGWFDQSQKQISEIEKGSAGDLVLTAKWEVAEYNIFYETNKGVNNPQNPGTYTSETDDIILKPAERTGYLFSGWFNLNNQQITVIKKGSSGDITLYAGWELIEYHIYYELDDAVNDPGNPQAYTIEDEFTLNEPFKDGYDFTGWFNGSGNEIKQIKKGSFGDITLYARFNELAYKIIYTLNGGSNNDANPEQYTVEDEFTFYPGNKKGYDFTGWFDEYGNEVSKIEKGTTGDLYLDARWKPAVYNIFYKTEGGINNVFNPASYTIESDDIVLLEATCEGYTFLGWFDKEGRSRTMIEQGSMGDITLYARWDAAVYLISYELRGGINNEDNPAGYTIESGDIILLPAFRDGYTFTGWFDEKGDKVIKILQGSTGNLILYAGWESIEYTITYHLDEGVNNPDNPQSFNGESLPIILLEPEKAGYEFIGWQNEHGEKVTAITQSGNITLYAIWKVVDRETMEDTLESAKQYISVANRAFNANTPASLLVAFCAYFSANEVIDKVYDKLDTDLKDKYDFLSAEINRVMPSNLAGRQLKEFFRLAYDGALNFYDYQRFDDSQITAILKAYLSLPAQDKLLIFNAQIKKVSVFKGLMDMLEAYFKIKFEKMSICSMLVDYIIIGEGFYLEWLSGLSGVFIDHVEEMSSIYPYLAGNEKAAFDSSAAYEWYCFLVSVQKSS